MLRRRRPVAGLAGGILGLLLGPGGSLAPAAAAELPAAVAQRLTTVLQSGQVDALKLVWTMGRQAEAHEQLQLDHGRATLQRCAPQTEAAAAPSCQAVGTPLVLTPGQREQLISALRSADLPHLRSADADARATVDRGLELLNPDSTTPLSRWQLSRSDWPTPPDGYGLAEFFDELGRKLKQTATARQPVPIPTTVAELDALRVQLRLTPRTRPGGLVTIEHGLVRVTPTEGSLPRSPPPRPWERPLSASEGEQLVSALQAAHLDELDQRVPKRAAPAIGDDDGRLATLHLLRAEPVLATLPQGSKAERELSRELPATDTVRVEPRGIERYLTDLMRSSAQPLCQKLVALLLADPPTGVARGAKAKGRLR